MLRKIRISVSILLFLILTIHILDYSDMMPQWLVWIMRIQLMPAVLSLSFGILVFILLLTMVMGRAYCSSICPMGTFQDIISWMGKRIPKRKRMPYNYSPAKNKLRYAMFLLVAVSLVSGIMWLPILIDPYTAYSRMMVNLMAPLVRLANNGIASASESNGSYVTLYTSVIMPSVLGFIISLVTFLTIGVLAWRNGRTFCNTICPVGSTLSLISRYSLLKIQIDEDKCVSCGKCGRNCKASCIDTKNHAIDYSRCVVCFDCIDSCSTSAISYSTTHRRQAVMPLMQPTEPMAMENKRIEPEVVKTATNEKVNTSRRQFLTAVGTIAVTGTAMKATDTINKIGAAAAGVKPIERKYPVTPPGALNVDYFTDHCTACHACVNQCPQGIIKPATLEYGISGIMQPLLVFDQGYCKEGCTACIDICPNDALTKISATDKRNYPVGKAQFVIENCVTTTDDVDCGACSRRCPQNAIEMVEKAGKKHKSPMINSELCIGCGACEYICPGHPYKAIYVDGIGK